MTNHPGDYHSFLHLAQLREEQLERKSKQRHLLADARPASTPGARAVTARMLRALADRLEPRTTAERRAPARYQSAP